MGSVGGNAQEPLSEWLPTNLVLLDQPDHFAEHVLRDLLGLTIIPDFLPDAGEHIGCVSDIQEVQGLPITPLCVPDRLSDERTFDALGFGCLGGLQLRSAGHCGLPPPFLRWAGDRGLRLGPATAFDPCPKMGQAASTRVQRLNLPGDREAPPGSPRQSDEFARWLDRGSNFGAPDGEPLPSLNVPKSLGAELRARSEVRNDHAGPA
jgi:hypothetical protein